MIWKLKAYFSYLLIASILIVTLLIYYFIYSLAFIDDTFINLLRNIEYSVSWIYNYIMQYKSLAPNFQTKFLYTIVTFIFLGSIIVYLLNKIKLLILRILILPFNTLMNFRRAKILISRTLKFNKKYSLNKDYKNIYKNNIDFLKYLIFNIKQVPIMWEKRTYFETDYNLINNLHSLNLAVKLIDKNAYISKLIHYGEYIEFEISSNHNIEILFSKLKKEENKKLLNLNSDFNNIETNIDKKNFIKVLVTPNDSTWVNQLSNIEEVPYEEKVINLWFHQEYNNWEALIKDYKLKYSDLIHGFIVWATRHGKDVLMLNITTSILKNIVKFNNSQLHFFDTKWSDWKYLNWLETYWIFRHKNKDKFEQILKSISNEIDKRQVKLWSFSNIKKYNQNNKEKMKDIFLIVNEFLDVSTFPNSNEIYSELISLLSKWASVGLHVILMSQTIRKDTHKLMWSVLVNIWNYFALKVNSKDEKDIVWKWLNSNERRKLDNQTKYNCLNISDSKIQKEFRAYLIDQETIQNWVKENFKIENTFEDEKLNSYYNYVIKNKAFIRKEAFENFELNEKSWNQVKEKLKSQDLIEEVAWKGYIFKE